MDPDNGTGGVCAITLGLFARTFPRPTIEEVFAAAAQYGVDCVQFNFACAGQPSLPDRLDPTLLERIRRAAQLHHLSLAAVSGTFNMIHPDPAQRRAGLARLEVIGAACPLLGTRVVTLCTGTRDPQDMWRPHPDNDTQEAWQDLLGSLRQALATADRHDLTLGIEPEVANVISSARKARRLLDTLRSPRLKIILDAANLFQAGDVSRMHEVLEEAFDLLAEDLVLVHAKELASSGHAGHLPLGAGILDWDHYVRLLRKVQFRGPVILHGFEEPHTTASVRFVQRLTGATDA